MGLVNTVVPLDRLEDETMQWCREMLALSPFSLRLLKASFNASEDGLAGIQQLAHDANLLFYGSEEAKRDARPTSRSASPTSTSSRGGHEAHMALMRSGKHDVGQTGEADSGMRARRS